MRRSLPIAIFALLLLIPGVIEAKGVPTRVTIYGPGLAGRIDVTDPALLPLLGLARLEDVSTPIIVPPVTGPGYEIERDGFDHERYYPDPAGGRGFIYYIGLINGSSEYDGHWYYASAESEQALKHILTEHGVRLAGALVTTPVANTPAASTALTASPITARASANDGMVWGITIPMIVVGGMLLYYRRRSRANRRAMR